SPQLGRLGLDDWARDLAPISFELVAIATRTEASARRACAQYGQWTCREPKAFWGETPWQDVLRAMPDIDVGSVATPGHLHTEVLLASLKGGANVIPEKPMCLETSQADQIIELAGRKNRIVSVDMHKRYDPDHLRIRDDIKTRIGEPLYGTAFLEEPLSVS